MDVLAKGTSMLKKVSFSTAVVGGLYLLLLILGASTGIRLSVLLTDTLHLAGVWALFSLASVPAIQSGTGPNFALPVGIVCGLLAMVLLMVMNVTGLTLLILSSLLAIVFGCFAGYLYGRLMNGVKGSEMAIAPYTGFAVVFFFSMVWLVLPTTELTRFPLGDGTRHMLQLDVWNADNLLSQFLQFDIFGVAIRTGEKLIIAIACILMWMFFRTRTGIGISAVGSNPMFAKATGINVDKSRIIANIISTCVAALGVIVYSNGFGFVQLYDAPLFWAFPAVAAILVGGASAQRSKVSNVIIGVFLFQGLMSIALPVLSNVVPTTEIINPIRQVIQNGVILYALTRMSTGGGK